MKKICILIFGISLMLSGCVHWIAKEETYQGTQIKITGEATSKSTSNKIRVVRHIDGRLYEVK